MRCPDCSKMVSYDEPQTEVQSEDIDDEGHITIEVRDVLPCAECGTELKEMIFSFDIGIAHECKPEEPKEGETKGDAEKEEKESGFDLTLDEPETTEDYKPKTDKKGKPVPQRYQKHFYGVKISGTATCNKCGEEIPFEEEQEERASAFDELV